MDRRVTWSRLRTSPPCPGDCSRSVFSRPSLRRWTTSRSCQWASSASTSGTSRRGREPPRQQAHARLGVPACCLWLPVPLARSAVIMALAAGPGIHLPNIFAIPPACQSPSLARYPGLRRSRPCNEPWSVPLSCWVFRPPQLSPPYPPLGCCAASACMQAPTAAMPVCRVGGWLRKHRPEWPLFSLQHRPSATVLACGVCPIGSVSLSTRRRCLPAV